MSTEKKEKKQRTPRNLESITAGAMALPLAEKVELVKRLKEEISKEVNKALVIAKEAAEITNGL